MRVAARYSASGTICFRIARQIRRDNLDGHRILLLLPVAEARLEGTLTFDAAIIGLGTMGTFACLELARRGLAVIGFDQFAPPHDRGSHSGATRVFRAAYAEHP